MLTDDWHLARMNPVSGERIEFLPDDVYSFLGQAVSVRSNSHQVLECLRSMYGRFYLGPDDPTRDQPSLRTDSPRHTIEITDSLEESNELLYRDEFQLYRFFRIGTHCRLSYQDLHTSQSLQHQLLEFYDPLSFVGAVVVRTISLLLEEHFLFHAGAVSCNGQGIVLPAAHGMGKTTLAVKLVMLGCEFLSDEIACLSLGRGVLEPFPRKVNIREPSDELLGLPLARGAPPRPVVRDGWEWSVDIEEISPASLGSACRPRYMVFPRGFGDEPKLAYIARSNALFELLECAVGQIEDPPRYLFQLAGLLNQVECYTLVIGDLDETARLVMDLATGSKDGEP